MEIACASETVVERAIANRGCAGEIGKAQTALAGDKRDRFYVGGGARAVYCGYTDPRVVERKAAADRDAADAVILAVLDVHAGQRDRAGDRVQVDARALCGTTSVRTVLVLNCAAGAGGQA